MLSFLRIQWIISPENEAPSENNLDEIFHLPFVIFDKKIALFAKSSVLRHFYVILRHFWVKLHKKCPFLTIQDDGLKL